MNCNIIIAKTTLERIVTLKKVSRRLQNSLERLNLEGCRSNIFIHRIRRLRGMNNKAHPNGYNQYLTIVLKRFKYTIFHLSYWVMVNFLYERIYIISQAPLHWSFIYFKTCAISENIFFYLNINSFFLMFQIDITCVIKELKSWARGDELVCN